MSVLDGRKNMKILLIQASNTPNKSAYDRLLENLSVLWPPSTIEYLASLTPNHHAITLIDENYQTIPTDEHFDLIGISYFTASAPEHIK